MNLIPLLLLLAAPFVFAGPTVKVALNFDSTVDTEFRAGDKPQAGGSCPTGWTCAVKGDGTEDIDEVSATSFTMVVSGADDEGNIGYAYKTTATDDDIEVVATIPATADWIGHKENFTGFGVGVTEGTGDADYASQCWIPNIAAPQVRFKSDAGGAGENEQLGATGQTPPRYVRYQYDDSATTESCWGSANGTDWFQVGTSVTKSLTFPVLGYVFGTSHNPNATTTATLTNIDHTNTLGGEGEGGGGEPPGGDACIFHFGPYDFSGESVGQAQTVAGTWQLSTSGVDNVDSTLEIVSTDPLIAGEKYIQTTCDKDDGCRRTERTLEKASDPFRSSSMVAVGGDDLRATEPYYVAFKMRIDSVGDSDGDGDDDLRGFLQQWHAPNGMEGSASPHHGLRGRDSDIRVYFKDRLNNAAPNDYGNVYYDLDLNWPDIQGEVIKYIWHVYWDGRTNAEGNEGFMRLYINDESTPRFALENERNLTYGDAESDDVLGGVENPHPYFKHGLYIVETLTGVYQQSYSRFLLGSNSCTRAEIAEALD